MHRTHPMKAALALATLALALAAPFAQAETMDDMRFGDISTMKMMGKVYDMKAKKMKSKGGVMSSIEFDEFAKYLRAGG
jgi:predicted outer membrane protein